VGAGWARRYDGGVPNDKTTARSSDAEHTELLQRAADVNCKSEELVRQLMDLASRIAETKAIAANADASRRLK